MDFFKNSGSYPEAEFLQGREADRLQQLIDFDYDEICDTYSETYAYYALSHNIILKLASKLLTGCKISPQIIKLLNRGQNKLKHTPPLSDMNALLSFYIVYDAKEGSGAKTIAEGLLLSMGVPPPAEAKHAIKNCMNSRWGIYEYWECIDTHNFTVKELATDKVFTILQPLGYIGKKGDLLMFRLLPSLTPVDTAVAVGAPFLLSGNSKQEWLDFLHEQDVVGGKKTEEQLVILFKKGPRFGYWIDFFLSLSGITATHYIVKGLPKQ